MNDKKENSNQQKESAIVPEESTHEIDHKKWWLEEAQKNRELILENERLKTQISNLKAVLKEIL